MLAVDHGFVLSKPDWASALSKNRSPAWVARSWRVAAQVYELLLCGLTTEDFGGMLQQLALPFCDLFGMQFKLAVKIGHRLVLAQGGQGYLGCECRRMCAAGASR